MNLMRTPALLAMTVLVLAGCGVITPDSVEEGVSGTPVSGQVCEGVPANLCAEELRRAQADAPPGAGGVAGIRIRCVAPSCTQAAGDVEVTVTYANGQTVMYGAGWMGPGAQPPPMPEPTELPVQPTCQGIPLAWCREQAATILGDAPTEAAPISVVVRCTRTCTLTEGEGEVRARFADGTEHSGGFGYSGEAPPAAP
jgi:hypothetical protein